MKSLINDEFFSRLETLALNFRSDLSGFFGGKHRTRSYGQTVEFSDFREYMFGDDIRRIDWNLYSRFEKYFLRLFTDERQMHAQFFLDCSASMGKPNPQKAAYAIGIAAALGFLSIHNMDKVSFKLIKKDTAEDMSGTIVGKNTFFKSIRDLENIEFKDEADIEKAVTNCPNPGFNDGLTVIISDFFTQSNWKKAVDFLTFKKRQVMLIQVLTPEEIEPTYSDRMHLIDHESEDVADPKNMKIKITRSLQMAYREALKDYNQELKSFCASRGADFISVNCERDFEKMLFEELMRTGIMV